MKTIILATIASMLVSGCAAQDPYTREGVWRPNGANDRNLRAMIANPDDLTAGAVDTAADGQVMAAAVARYRSGRVKELGDATASKISPITVNTGTASAPAGDSD